MPHFRSESRCKDKCFFSFPPNLSASFFKLFFQTLRLSIISCPRCRLLVSDIIPHHWKRGAKIRTIYLTPNFSGEIFKVFFHPCFKHYSEELFATLKHWGSTPSIIYLTSLFNPSFPDCGCKDNATKSPFPNFYTTFFNVFWNYFSTNWYTDAYKQIW